MALSKISEENMYIQHTLLNSKVRGDLNFVFVLKYYCFNLPFLHILNALHHAHSRATKPNKLVIQWSRQYDIFKKFGDMGYINIDRKLEILPPNLLKYVEIVYECHDF